MARFDVKVTGIEDAERAIGRIIKSVHPDQVEPVLVDSAEIMTRQVQQNVNAIPPVTGNLARAPVTKQLPARWHGEPRPAIAAMDRRIAPHAWLVEFYNHGGTRPYFRPAILATRGAAMSNLMQALKSAIEGAP